MSSLFQEMACSLFGNKPLNGGRMVGIQLEPWEQLSLNLNAMQQSSHKKSN